MTEGIEKLMKFIEKNYNSNTKIFSSDIEMVIRDLSLTMPNVDETSRLNNLMFMYDLLDIFRD